MTSWMKKSVNKIMQCCISTHDSNMRCTCRKTGKCTYETASLLYNRMMENMGYGQEGLKGIVEKEVGEEQQQEEEDWGKDPWLLKFVPDRVETRNVYQNPWSRPMAVERCP